MLEGEIEDVTLPATLQQALSLRLAVLYRDEELQALLELGAALGGQFTLARPAPQQKRNAPRPAACSAHSPCNERHRASTGHSIAAARALENSLFSAVGGQGAGGCPTRCLFRRRRCSCCGCCASGGKEVARGCIGWSGAEARRPCARGGHWQLRALALPRRG